MEKSAAVPANRTHRYAQPLALHKLQEGVDRLFRYIERGNAPGSFILIQLFDEVHGCITGLGAFT